VKKSLSQTNLKIKVMKRSIRFIMAGGALICALFAGSAIAATAKTDLGKPSPNSIRIQLKQLDNSEIIRLIIDNPEGRKISITLSDLSGSFIQRTFGSKKEMEVVRDYNFEGAEEGTYQLDIYDGHSNVKKEIHLKRVHQDDITLLSVH
jgi:hypothetical protein